METNGITMDSVVIREETEQIMVPLQKMEVEGKKDGHIVDIDIWAASLSRMLDDVPQYMCRPGHPGRVSRIPENLRKVDLKSYEPCFLSIGPYYHGRPSLQRMEKRKQFVLKCVLEQKPELTVRDFLMETKSIETLARSFYSDVDMESEEFVRMLLLDSLYILSVFCGRTDNQEWMTGENTSTGNSVEDINEWPHQIKGEDNNKMLIVTRENESNYEKQSEKNIDRPRWFWILLEHDLFLLENQLPFFVLQKVYTLAYGGSEMHLMVRLKNEVSKLLTQYTSLDSDMVISRTTEVHHLLHLCHMFFRPLLKQDSILCQLPESSQMFRLGSAVQLYEEGINFEARSGSTKHTLLDIRVDNHGKVYMPCLYVEDNTVSLLRNLIALEQMKYPSLGLDVSAYAVLLLHLITIPEDVMLLRRKGIIHHHLASDKEMVQLVNKLSVGLSFDYAEDKYTLKPIFRELKRYSERRTPKWRVWLKHRYFNNPWTAISLFAASLLLLLTVAQTYFTVYSYYHPR